MDILILVNPAAGNHKGIRWLTALRDRANEGTLAFRARIEPTRRGSLLEQLRELGTGMSRVLVVGGDGTVSAVLDAAQRLSLDSPVGIVPSGTGNDLARSLGLYAGRPWKLDQALRYCRSSRSVPVDLWSINEQCTFSNYVSVGLDADVVRGFCRLRRWIQDHPALGTRGVYFATYLFVWARSMGSRLPADTHLSWEDPAGIHRSVRLREPRVITVTNTPYYAAGALMDPGAVTGDGLVEITVFPNMRHYAELMAMRVPAFARRGIQMRWWRLRARSARLQASGTLCVQADGEDLTDRLAGRADLSIRRRGQIPVLVNP
jgi:diacylglycerol kinase (ATP)